MQQTSGPRHVIAASTSRPTLEGAGVHLRRAFGFENPEATDPFLLFDDFRSDTPAHYLKGFPWHPHRGIDTITYVLKGEVDHGDSLRNQGTIGGGEVQWMTAGSGIIHQEMPRGDANGSMHGFQLWLNLAKSEKLCHPRYRDVTAADIPVLTLPHKVSVRIISGRLNHEGQEVAGPVSEPITDPHYFDIELPANADCSIPLPSGYNVLAYVTGGAVVCAAGGELRESYKNTTLLRFGDGDRIEFTGGPDSGRLLLLAGKPLREPIAWQGPIVMNSDEELEEAFAEYQNGTFLRDD